MKTKCENCGANMKVWIHSLTPGLVNTLIKFGRVAISKKVRGKNTAIHLQNEAMLTKNEYNNFQKLRYFDLVMTDEKMRGSWILTMRGYDFLRNKITVSRKVHTFRNSVVEKSDEQITIHQVFRGRQTVDYWEKEFDYNIVKPKLL